MKIERNVATARTSANDELSLHEHDGDWGIRYNGRGLMHSRMNASEVLIGEIACENLKEKSKARILVGGLGLGYTLKAVLENTALSAEVHVCELIPEVVEWNKTHMRELNGHLMDDERVAIHICDVFQMIKKGAKHPYDSIVLDVDNGPVAMVAGHNKDIYRKSGVSMIKRALTPKGRASVWSGGIDDKFEKILKNDDFAVKRIPAKTHPNARSAIYQIYVGDKLG